MRWIGPRRCRRAGSAGHADRCGGGARRGRRGGRGARRGRGGVGGGRRRRGRGRGLQRPGHRGPGRRRARPRGGDGRAGSAPAADALGERRAALGSLGAPPPPPRYPCRRAGTGDRHSADARSGERGLRGRGAERPGAGRLEALRGHHQGTARLPGEGPRRQVQVRAALGQALLPERSHRARLHHHRDERRQGALVLHQGRPQGLLARDVFRARTPARGRDSGRGRRAGRRSCSHRSSCSRAGGSRPMAATS